MNQMIIDVQNGQIRMAIVIDRELAHFFMERENERSNYGNIYMGRVEQIKSGIQAAFVNIGEGKNGMLHANDVYPNDDHLPIEKCLKEGQELVVQVKKEGVGGKGPRLTAKCSLSGYYLVLLCMEKKVYVSKKIRDAEEKKRLKAIATGLRKQDFGLIVRTEAQGASEEDIKRELDYLLIRWKKVNPIEKAPKCLLKNASVIDQMIRDYYNEEIDEVLINHEAVLGEVQTYFHSHFPEHMDKVRYVNEQDLIGHCGIEGKVSELFDRKVWLKSGGYIVIDYTEACTVIDVNSGKYTGRNDKEETFLKINREATEAIADQIRLRNIGGIIIIDYINIKGREEQEAVTQYLRQCLQKDKATTKIYGFTDLCMLQMTRQQRGKRLMTVQMEECKICGGRGTVERQETLYYKAIAILDRNQHLLEQEKFTIKVNPYLRDWIEEKEESGEGSFVQMLEKHYSRPIQVEVDPYLSFGEMKIY